MLGEPIFGKKIMAKSRLALRWLEDHPECTVTEAARMFQVKREYVLKRLERKGGRRCPICEQRLAHAEPLANVNRYMTDYSSFLNAIMDATRIHGTNCTNEEILELVHNSLISGSTPCQHSTPLQQA